MKLSRLLLVGCATFALAGCDFFGKKEDEKPAKTYDLNPEITGGSEEEKTAILEVLNSKPICNKKGTATSEIFYDTTANLLEDDGDVVYLTTTQKQSGLDVKIEWDVDTSQKFFGGWLDPEDGNHKIIDVKYTHYGTEGGTLQWSISKMTCGSAVAANPNVTYTANVTNETLLHNDVTIADIYAFVDQEKDLGEGKIVPSQFNLVNYDKKDADGHPNPYFDTNNPTAPAKKQYYYVNVVGKVIFLAPDGNFGLLADGNRVLEMYAGGGTKLLKENFPYLEVGNYVKVTGNLSQFCGNVQVGFLTKVGTAKASDLSAPVPDPLVFDALDATKIASLTKEGFETPSQAVKVAGQDYDMMGSLRSITGTYKAGTLSVCDGDANLAASWSDPAETDFSDLSATKRAKFVMTLEGGVEYTVAYDKHSNSRNNDIFSALKAKLEAGAAFTVKGFSRYFGSDSSCFMQEGTGAVWTVVPFSPSHIA